MNMAKTLETTVSARDGLVGRVIAAVCVGLFGLGLVWAAGFANAGVLHNTAHDSRHSLAFPCH